MNRLSQVAIYKDGVHIANVPSLEVVHKPVAVPWNVWAIIRYWAQGANYAPKYRGFTWEWHKNG